jgi:hypothetical protein
MSRVPMTVVSFSDGESALGLVVLDGEHDAETAARLTRFANLNPGGMVIAQRVPDSITDEDYERCRLARNRLLTTEQAKAVFPNSGEVQIEVKVPA